jgi:hypothetical protein
MYVEFWRSVKLKDATPPASVWIWYNPIKGVHFLAVELEAPPVQI